MFSLAWLSQRNPELDKWLDKCGEKAVLNKDQIAFHAYFALGGTDKRILEIAKEKGIAADEETVNKIRSLACTLRQSLENLTVKEIFLDMKGCMEDKDHIVQAFLTSQCGLKKILDIYRQIHLERRQYPAQRRTLISRLEYIVSKQVVRDNSQAVRFSIIESLRDDTILNDAIGSGCVALVDALVPDTSLDQALEQAARHGQLRIVELLVSRGASLRAGLMHQAALHRHAHVVKFLRGKGFDLDTLDQYGFTPYSIAAALRDVKLQGELQAIQKLRNPKVPSFLMMEKMMCHRFGINQEFAATYKKTNFDGMYKEMGKYELLESLERYLEKGPPSTVNNFNWNEVLEVVRRISIDFNTSEYSTFEIPNNGIVALLAGWRKHSTGLVIRRPQDPQEPSFLIKCNRGIRSKGEAGMTIYEIKDIEQLARAAIQNHEHLDSVAGQKFFEDDIDQLLKLKQVGSISHKDQSTGNCSWASAKLMVKAIIYLTLLKHYPVEEAEKISHRLYKEWTAADRFQALENFLRGIEDLKREDIKSNEHEGIIPETILERVLFKCLRGRLVDCLSLLISYNPKLLAARDAKGRDVLHVAAELGQLNLIPLLVSEDAAINSGNIQGAKRAFAAALRSGRCDLVKLLSGSFGIDINAYVEGSLPLTFAFESRDQETIQFVMHHKEFDPAKLDFQTSLLVLQNIRSIHAWKT